MTLQKDQVPLRLHVMFFSNFICHLQWTTQKRWSKIFG